jgi:ABC-type transporter lipoprotein component MlaA
MSMVGEELVMKQYRAWGEYGVHSGDYIELPIFEAEDNKVALAYAITELSKDRMWHRIGEHNVYLEEYIPPKHDIIHL